MKHQKGEPLDQYARTLLHNYLDLVWEIAAIETLKEPTPSEISELIRLKGESQETSDKLIEEIGVATYISFLQAAIKSFQECEDSVDEFIEKITNVKP